MVKTTAKAYFNHYQEDILTALGRYFFLTADQITRTYFQTNSQSYQSSLRHAQREITKLSRADYIQIDNWINRFPGKPGKPAPVYTLSDKGRRYLERQGKTLPNAYIPSEEHSEYFLKHTLNVNDVLLLAERFARAEDGVQLEGMLHEKEFKHAPHHYQTHDNRKSTYAADGWWWFGIQTQDGLNDEAFVLELDRATEDKRETWWSKLRGLLSWRDHEYVTQVDTDAFTLAVVCATGENRKDTDEGRLARRRKLLRWTEELLTADKRLDEAGKFLFIDADPARVSPNEFFCRPLWYQPFGTSPVPLLATMEQLAAVS